LVSKRKGLGLTYDVESNYKKEEKEHDQGDMPQLPDLRIRVYEKD
jgi:hypothetical protein